jgi:hypothetical protein
MIQNEINFSAATHEIGPATLTLLGAMSCSGLIATMTSLTTISFWHL